MLSNASFCSRLPVLVIEMCAPFHHDWSQIKSKLLQIHLKGKTATFIAGGWGQDILVKPYIEYVVARMLLTIDIRCFDHIIYMLRETHSFHYKSLYSAIPLLMR